MKQRTYVYCAEPVRDSRLACALLGLSRRGVLLVERPLSALPQLAPSGFTHAPEGGPRHA